MQNPKGDMTQRGYDSVVGKTRGESTTKGDREIVWIGLDAESRGNKGSKEHLPPKAGPRASLDEFILLTWFKKKMLFYFYLVNVHIFGKFKWSWVDSIPWQLIRKDPSELVITIKII